MGKSLRSKWKRKCRAIKRERYKVKELERLKKTLGIDENGIPDVEMSEISKIATGRAQFCLICYYFYIMISIDFNVCLKLLMPRQ